MTTLEAYKYWFQEHLDDLKAQCNNDTQRNEVLALFVKTCEAYEESINKILEPGNQAVAQLTKELEDVQEQINRAIDRQQDIADIINKVSTGVGIAAKLAGLLLPTPTKG